ncbi:tyrosine-type recombinase/integrase [Bacteroidota bacterium]
MKNNDFYRLTEGFKEWLGIMGYVQSSIETMPRRVNKFFIFLQKQKVYEISQIKRKHIEQFYSKLKTTKSKQTGELLKNSTLNGTNRILRLFTHYLEETGQGQLTIDIPYEKKEPPEREILTLGEIKALYNEVDETILGLRDRAMLNIYYGCGLRSKEGISLDLKDVMTDKNLVYVRKGKQYRERYVPFTYKQKKDFEIYLKSCRKRLVKDQEQQSFLVNNKGKRISSTALHKRLKVLSKTAGINKTVGLHMLRHSIATHLMQSGMKIEDIATFLGHKNIESTQRYTHLSIENG